MATERAQESKTVKDALTKAGYTNVSVKHGTGTAWGWMRVKATVTVAKPKYCSCGTPDEYGRIETCPPCRYAWHDQTVKVSELARIAAGRSNNEYGGNINASVEVVEP